MMEIKEGGGRKPEYEALNTNKRVSISEKGPQKRQRLSKYKIVDIHNFNQDQGEVQPPMRSRLSRVSISVQGSSTIQRGNPKPNTQIKQIISVERFLSQAFENSDHLQPLFVQKYGIPLYEAECFKHVSTLDRGSMGEIIKGIRNKDKEFVMIKKINTVQSIPNNTIDKIKNNISTLLVEKSILERLAGINSIFFPSYIGIYYTIKEKDAVDYIVLVSTSGECSLEKLIESRKSSRPDVPAYEESEAVNIIRQIVSGLKVLQENRVYHSDLKLSNIVVNLSKNCYQINEFGVSKIIPSGKDSVEREIYAVAGSSKYFSPEKRAFWDLLIKDEEIPEQEAYYNPFKDDVWSLGICLAKMIGGAELAKGNLKVLIDKMLTRDWENRPDAKELDTIINKLYGPQGTVFISDEEKSIVKRITDKVKEDDEDFVALFRNYSKTASDKEQLQFLEKYLKKKMEKKEEDRSEQDDKAIAWLYHQIGIVHFQLESYDEALQNLEQALEISQKVYGDDNEAVLTILDLIGSTYFEKEDYSNAVESYEEIYEIQKKCYGTEVTRYVTLTLYSLGKSYSKLKQHQKALNTFKNVYDIQMDLYKTEQNDELSKILSLMAYEHSQLGDSKKALEVYEKVLTIRLKLHKTEFHIDVATVHSNMGHENSIIGNHKGSLEHHEKALQIKMKVLKTEIHSSIGDSLLNIGWEKKCLQDYSGALSYFQRALDVFRKVYSKEDHPRILLSNKRILSVMSKLNEQK